MRTIADLHIEIAEINKLIQKYCRKYATKGQIDKVPFYERVEDYREFVELDQAKQRKLLAANAINQLYKWN